MRILLAGLFLIGASCVLGQTSEPEQYIQEILTRGDILSKELRDSLGNKDLSPLWTGTENAFVFGFIGDNYERFRIKLLSVIKDPADPLLYRVYGKNMVKNNICEFQGEFRVTAIRRYADVSYGVDETYRDSAIQGRYLVCGTYRLLEDPIQQHSGLFSGSFASYFYLDRNGAVRYDNIDEFSDGHCNNQFVGTWSSYEGHKTKRCNWGDGRIPNAGYFDMGAGEFSPAEEYLMNGWQNIKPSYQFGPEGDRARSAERVEWWK
jgi:hypothetical protein